MKLFGAFTVALMLAGASLVASPVAAQSLSDEQRGEVEAVVRDYLLKNPEILEEAFAALQTKRQQAEQENRNRALTEQRDVLEDSTRQVVLGNPDGDVTLVEFFDYNCGYCRRAVDDMNRLIAEDENLRIVLKEFPVLGQGSVEAAQVATAVNEIAPEKYADFHQAMFKLNRPADGRVAMAVAKELGLSEESLKAEIEKPTFDETREEVYTLASALGLTGTPSYVIGDEVLFGAVGYDRLKEQVNVARCGQAIC